MSTSDPVFQPIQIGALTAQNRFVINAMECCDGDEEGNPTEKTYRRYRNLFESRVRSCRKTRCRAVRTA